MPGLWYMILDGLKKSERKKSERLAVTYLLGTKIYRSEEQMVFCFQNCSDLL